MGSIGATQYIGAHMAMPIKSAQNMTLRGI